MKYNLLLIYLFFQLSASSTFSQEQMNHTDSTSTSVGVENQHDETHTADHTHDAHGEHAKYDPAATAIHHISDANVYTILDFIRIPLPIIIYAPERGWDIFSAGKFHPGHHDDGHFAYNGYALHHGSVHRVVEAGFPVEGEVEISGFVTKPEEKDGKPFDATYVLYQGKEYRLDARSTLDGGVLGGGITSFYDF